MDGIRIWSMRIAAAVSLVVGLLALPAAIESLSLSPTILRGPLGHRGMAAIVLPVLFIVAGLVASVASSRRFAESTQLRIGAAMLLVVSLAFFAFGYAIEFGGAP